MVLEKPNDYKVMRELFDVLVSNQLLSEKEARDRLSLQFVNNACTIDYPT